MEAFPASVKDGVASISVDDQIVVPKHLRRVEPATQHALRPLAILGSWEKAQQAVQKLGTKIRAGTKVYSSNWKGPRIAEWVYFQQCMENKPDEHEMAAMQLILLENICIEARKDSPDIPELLTLFEWVSDIIHTINFLYHGETKKTDSMLSWFIQSGSLGGKAAAENRKKTREELATQIRKVIDDRHLWGGFDQNLKSITDTIWPEIKAAMDNGTAWRGIPSEALLSAKIGHATVYNVVRETEPC